MIDVFSVWSRERLIDPQPTEDGKCLILPCSLLLSGCVKVIFVLNRKVKFKKLSVSSAKT
jgi:hypothetical protein